MIDRLLPLTLLRVAAEGIASAADTETHSRGSFKPGNDQSALKSAGNEGLSSRFRAMRIVRACPHAHVTLHQTHGNADPK
jgi:hypothetical protein